MKKVFAILGVVFAVILVIIVIVAANFFPGTLKQNREAEARICFLNAVPEIVEHWNQQDLYSLATPEFLKNAKNKDEVERLFAMFSKLGALKHLDTPKGAVYSGTGAYTVGNYTAEAEFQNGKATIKIQLLRIGEVWKINGFRIYSDAFLPPKA